MAISFDCPHCGTHMEVLDRYAGQTGPCAVCAKTITIPGAIDASPSHPNSRSPTAKRPEQDQGVSLGTLLGIIGGSIACFAIIFIASVLVVRVAIPAANKMRIDSMNRASLDNIRRITKALNQYHADHGTYPPAFFVDAKGKPAHSWRVMILPQLGRNDLYQQYNFNDTWDSPTNLNVAMQMPDVYSSHGGNGIMDNTTRMCAVVGKRTMFPQEKSVTRSQILDDPASTMCIVEVQGIGFDWTDPAENYNIDSPQGTMVISENIQPTGQLSSSTLTGNVGMLNEDAYHFGDSTSVTLMQSLATRSGSEEVAFELNDAANP